MSEHRIHTSLSNTIPFISNKIAIWQGKRNQQTLTCHDCNNIEVAQHHPDLLHYPIPMFPLLSASSHTQDEAGVLCHTPPDGETATYHPVQIAQFGLAHWNAYLSNGDNQHKETFLAQASWLLTHQAHFVNHTAGWTIPFRIHHCDQPQYLLAASAQGLGISVLIRAYQLTSDDTFLQATQKVVQTFELDILDGGINTPIGDNGIFFEEIAAYPAVHSLSGHLLAMLALYDYVAISRDNKIASLIKSSDTALHAIIDEFDTGYWTYTELLHKYLASRLHHSLHIHLLEALAAYTSCQHCTMLARRWKGYQNSVTKRCHYQLRQLAATCYDHTAKTALRLFFCKTPSTVTTRASNLICVPIQVFPVPGGMKSVLAGVARTMDQQWQMTYLTNKKGPDTDSWKIEVFGTGRITAPWQFPNVWLYCLAGGHKLFKLLQSSRDFSLILPQDGLCTAAFAALVGKMTGVRIVCMDHGNITWLENAAIRRERTKAIEAYSWWQRFIEQLRYIGYWPSLRLLAMLATPLIDHFLIAGDEVEEVYRKQLGVCTSHITRYAYIVDTARFLSPDQEVRRSLRIEHGYAEDAIIITLINRLAPEKGLSFALEGIALALSTLSPDIRKRVQVLIAGEGPLQAQIEADILRSGLTKVCKLWGVAHPPDVIKLLGLSNIFLYSGIRGTNYSMAVLEAMAAGCAVVATTSPQSNAKLLASGRGIAIAPGNAQVIATALTRLCNDLELCQHMGQLARTYIATNHSAATLKRTLSRVSFFVPSLQVDGV